MVGGLGVARHGPAQSLSLRFVSVKVVRERQGRNNDEVTGPGRSKPQREATWQSSYRVRSGVRSGGAAFHPFSDRGALPYR